jgi:AbrB family looped-hinge helix DNA binding protein
LRITEKGQVTIPVEIRERFGLLPHTEVEFVVQDDAVTIVPARDRTRRGEAVVRRLRGGGTVGMTTDEILALTRGE